MPAMTFNPQAFYETIDQMRQFFAASRLLEACLEADGFSQLDFERPNGRQVTFLVDPVDDAQQGEQRRSVKLCAPGHEPREILSVTINRRTDSFSLVLDEAILAVACGPGEVDPAVDVVADLVRMASAVSLCPAGVRMAAKPSSNDALVLLWHAQGARHILEHIPGASSQDRAVLLTQVAADAARYHELCEKVCNDADHDACDVELDAIEQRLVTLMAGAGAPSLRFTRDPRGLPVRIVTPRGEFGMLQVPKAIRSAPAPRLTAVDRAPARSRKAGKAAAQEAVPLRERVVDPDVLQVLRVSRLEGDRMYLPGQLDRKLYERVDEFIRICGGRWVGGKTRAHVLGERAEAFARMVATGQVLDPKDFDFFATPDALAAEAVALAGLKPGMRVAEPSAGRGAIAKHLAAAVGPENVTAFELLPEHVKVLREMGLTVREGDFLAQPAQPLYDAVVMNPPFGGQADMKHVEHALRMLKPGGCLVAIMSPAFESRTTRQAEGFRDLMQAAGEKVRDVEAGTFRESGTDVRTVLVRFEADRLPWNQGARHVVSGGMEVPAAVQDRAEDDALEQVELFSAEAMGMAG